MLLSDCSVHLLFAQGVLQRSCVLDVGHASGHPRVLHHLGLPDALQQLNVALAVGESQFLVVVDRFLPILVLLGVIHLGREAACHTETIVGVLEGLVF